MYYLGFLTPALPARLLEVARRAQRLILRRRRRLPAAVHHSANVIGLPQVAGVAASDDAVVAHLRESAALAQPLAATVAAEGLVENLAAPLGW